ncbi:hypothetical protein FACS1894124_7830 [Spirochaetia bacterium]|nr:hypothetical protein FACS1894124_7830 [Spirochaetia bacterium]
MGDPRIILCAAAASTDTIATSTVSVASITMIIAAIVAKCGGVRGDIAGWTSRTRTNKTW